MTEKNIEKTFEITNIIKTYVADDGKEFSNMNECVIYENELFFNRYADKYTIKSISVPTFICDDNRVYGISFYFPQSGDEDEVMRLLSIYQNYEISKSDNKWKIEWTRDLSNVCNSNLEIKMPSLNKGENYIFFFSWEEYYDGYDYYHNQIISKEIAMTKLEKEIKEFEEIFETKFEEKKINECVRK